MQAVAGHSPAALLWFSGKESGAAADGFAFSE